MNKLVLIAIVFSGCAAPTYTTRHGINVYDNTTVIKPTQAEVEEITTYVINELGHAKKFDGLDVMLINKWIHVPRYQDDGFNLADGYTNIWDGSVIASVFQSCLADSGLVHELAHVIHDVGKLIPDWWHEDKEFWGQVKVMEAQIIADKCPSDFKHIDIPPDYVPAKL